MTALDTTEAASESPRADDAAPAPWWRPRRVDLLALGVWAASRVVILIVSLVALSSRSGTSWLGLWGRWDWERYLTIAEYGYTSGQGPAYDTNLVAFFPGFPFAVRLVHFVVPDWTVAGLLVSFIAGAVAVVALARLTEFEWSEWHTRRGDEAADARGGSRADQSRAAVTSVLLLVCAPAAIFLAAGYTEALFLALAVPAWLAARRRHWIAAGVLTALACTVRINGVFVAAGILVMFALSRPRARDWRRAPALALPAVAVVGYMAYLKDIKNDWLAWLHAEKSGWGRTLTNPVTAFRTSWQNAFGSTGRSIFGGNGGGGGGGFTGRFRSGTGSGTGGQSSGGFGSGTSGGAPGGTSGGTSSGTLGGTSSGTSGGTGGGTSSGTSGGTLGGTSGGTSSGTSGGALGGTSGGTSSGTLGGSSGGTSGGFQPGTGGGTRNFTGTGSQHGGLAGVGSFGPWPFRLEILAMLAGVVLLGWLAFRRRWAEVVYVGISVIVLGTSTDYLSVPREMLLWWPLWISLGIWLSRRLWATLLYAAVSTAAMIGIAWLFLTGAWAG